MASSYFTRKIKAIEVKKKSVSDLLAEMSKTAYQGRKLGEAVDVWEAMLNEKGLVIIMGFSGSMSTAGQWQMINWLIENRYIDVLVGQLRKKLDERAANAKIITTIHGTGYLFTPEVV